MRGDILIIQDHHQQAAKEAIQLIISKFIISNEKFLVTVAGESGAGKSELASAMKGLFEKQGWPTYILQQDDYFNLPPKTNEKARVIDINRVGPGEVRLELLNENIRALKNSRQDITKPLVIFDEDRIVEETLDLSGFKIILIEGTYTTLLENIDCRIFIDRNRTDTREDRQKRNRERQNDYLESILEIEHRIISRHKEMADIIISKDFKASIQP